MPRSTGAAGFWRSGALLLLFPLLMAGAACQDAEEIDQADEPILILTQTSFEALPGWQDDMQGDALPALSRSCARLTAQPASEPGRPEPLTGNAKDWQPFCRILAALDPADHEAVRALMEIALVPFEAEGPDGPEGLFTGYYEAELRGARRPDENYRWPLYRKPDDLIVRDGEDGDGKKIKEVGRLEGERFLPYHSRAEIEQGALEGRGLELIWVDDPVDAFFLHVQGSGRVVLPDGGTTRVGYAASNGRAFTAIGRYLIENEIVEREQVSMQAIRDWLRANPEKAREVMELNERFIFFEERGAEGPIGAQGVALTPGRSLAVDRSYVPLGLPLWLDTTWPASDRPLRRLMVAQDTGGAIKGPVRGDFFWGPGEPALEQAGRMKQSGRYWLLLPRGLAERRGLTS